MKLNKIGIIGLAALLIAAEGCQNFDALEANPNIAGDKSNVPPSYLLGKILYDIYQGGGVTDGAPGRVFEGPWDQLQRWNQYVVGNESYYGGENAYNWSFTATPYSILKNTEKMELQAAKSLNPDLNAYKAMGKFIRAYVYIWYTQRVGDIPTDEAGLGLQNQTPGYTVQKDVYAKALQLLEEANSDLNTIIPTISTATNIDGDIYLGNSLKKWQKVINSYRLRVLISLSRRADDAPELNIKQRFAGVLADPTTYPVLGSNGDNLQFIYNQQYNPYPIGPTSYYNNYINVTSTFLDLLTAVQDPRTFVLTSPSPYQVAPVTADPKTTGLGKPYSDFTAYKGASNGQTLQELANAGGSNGTLGPYSFISYLRYNQTFAGPEPYVILGYPELCFNIAEAINRGWVTGSAASYYTKGIQASLDFYGLKEGGTVNVGNWKGESVKPVTVSVNTFLANAIYVGDTPTGLRQILEQKYVAFFQNSGWEAFYNWRRTGFPSTFVTSGNGINPENKIPMRWEYPVDEVSFNSTNVNSAIQRQYGAKDDRYATMWSLK